jgi:hypothetical protein
VKSGDVTQCSPKESIACCLNIQGRRVSQALKYNTFLLCEQLTSCQKKSQDYWGFGLSPSFGILNTREHNVSASIPDKSLNF